PGERDLRHGYAALLRRCLERPEQRQVLLEVSFLKPRMGVTAVARNEIVAFGKAAAEETAAERRVGDKADAELLERRQDLVRDVAGPQRIFGLDRGDRMGLVGTANGFCAGLAQAEMADLALLHEPRHGPDRLLDRHVGVDAMDVIEIDRL